MNEKERKALLEKEYSRFSTLHKEIQALVDSGVLGSELCPQPHFWHWPVLKPELLPEDWKFSYEEFGEIRLY